MEVRTLCVRLLLNVLMLGAYVHHSYAEADDAALAWIIPTRLQLFDYDSISFNCESSNNTTGWKVFRRLKGKVGACVSNWEIMAPSICAIKPVYPSDSGEYWCETGDGKRSNTVNITITAGTVILESPVLPVVEGESVTLRCRSKKTSITHIADFYKDGLFTGSGSFGEITIKRVLKSHEGLYKCSISDFGESPVSWLAVRGAVHTEIGASSDHNCHTYLILRTVFTIVMVFLLLLLVGLLHCGKLVSHKNK